MKKSAVVLQGIVASLFMLAAGVMVVFAWPCLVHNQHCRIAFAALVVVGVILILTPERG